MATMKCSRCGKPCDMYKAKDWLWKAAGFNPSEFACINCLGDGYQCVVGILDMEDFPWWKSRPDYERGVLDGLGRSFVDDVAASEYQAGVKFGQELARRSTDVTADEFIARNLLPQHTAGPPNGP